MSFTRISLPALAAIVVVCLAGVYHAGPGAGGSRNKRRSPNHNRQPLPAPRKPCNPAIFRIAGMGARRCARSMAGIHDFLFDVGKAR